MILHLTQVKIMCFNQVSLDTEPREPFSLEPMELSSGKKIVAEATGSQVMIIEQQDGRKGQEVACAA